jgi:hypothetical protein
MVIDGLPATVGGLGLVSDLSMGAGQAGGGVGDPGGNGYLEHGVKLLGVSLEKNPTHRVHPLE